MNPARHPQPDPTLELPPVAPTPLPRIPPARSDGRRMRVKTVGAGVILLLAAIGGTATKLTSPAQHTEAHPIAVAGFAQDFVHTYLTSSGEGSAEGLLPFLGYTPSLDGMDPGRFYVTHLSTREIRTLGSEWIVGIKADLLESIGQGYQRSDPLWLSVTVAQDEYGDLRAVSLPALLSEPAAEPLSPHRPDSLPADPSTVASVSALTTWYLTDSAPLRGTVPVGGFIEAELMSLRIEDDSALAGINATTATGHVLRVDIPLERVDGTWRVAVASRPPS